MKMEPEDCERGPERRAALRCRTELQRKLAQTFGEFFVRSDGRLFRRERFFLFQFRDSRQDFVGGNHPVHRNGVTTIRRTNHAQRSGSTSTSNDENTVTINDVAAGQTVTLFAERLPFPVAIEPLQNFEFL